MGMVTSLLSSGENGYILTWMGYLESVSTY